MEGGACNDCGCWAASCHFISCLVPGRCSTCLQPQPQPQSPAAPPLHAPILQQISKSTEEQLDDFISFMEHEVNRLDPASSSSSSQASISQHLSDMLAELEKNQQFCTSLIESLPKELTNEVAGNGRTLFMPLLTKALGGMGGVQWLGVGFTFIAWSLSNINNVIQNRADCIGILRRSLRLLRNTKEIWWSTNVDEATKDENLRDSVEKAFRCAIFCTSNLDEHWILRFLKATSVKDAVAMLAEDLDRANIQNIEFMNRYMLRSGVKRQITFQDSSNDIVGESELEVIKNAVTFLEAGPPDRIKAVLLHGMGGIGKSTLGLRIFMQFQKNSVYRACRVELPLKCESEHLSKAQEEIIEKVSGHAASKFSNPMDGMQHMKKELQQIRHPIFLYADNILEGQHLFELLPDASFFPEGSRLLITSRQNYADRRLVVDLGISADSCKAIEVRKLQKEQAQRLLWRQLQNEGEHRKNSEIESAEQKGLARCDGLPLALVLVGKYIAANDKGLDNVEVWHEVVKAMEEARPFEGNAHDELYDRLQFSIRNLDENTKQAFMDVAFLLATTSPWRWSWNRGERLVGRDKLQVLSNRALLQIDEKRCRLRMHDVLKALGCKMGKEDKQELRIATADEFDELDGSALNKLVALSGVRNVDALRLKQMPRLRLLIGVHVMEECEGIQLSKLRVVIGLECARAGVLDWSKCASLKEVGWEGSVTPDVSNLEVFKHDRISRDLEALSLRDWRKLKDVQVIETLTCLRELCLIKCPEIEPLPDEISRLTALEQLNLRWCTGLKGLPQGISSLRRLEELHLVGCESVRSLPDGLTSLTGLTKLELRECKSLQSIPESIGNLRGLTCLSLEGCRSLASIPEGAVSSMNGLTELSLDGCASIEYLPEGIRELTGLQSLSLTGCRRLQILPEGISNLTGLTFLGLDGCRRLQALPEAGLTRLTDLQLSECRALQSLPDMVLSRLTTLTNLSLRRCTGLRSIEAVTMLTALKTLDLQDCLALHLLPEGITKLARLRHIGLKGCGSLTSIPEGLGSRLLDVEDERLDLSDCKSLKSLPESIGSCTSLKSLDLRDCTSLESLPEAATRLSNLTCLTLLGCRRPQLSLPGGLANSLTGLVELKLGECTNPNIGPLLEEVSCSMRELRVLELSECQDLQSLPRGMVTNLKSLQKLFLRGCAQFQSLPQGVANWTGLTELDLSGCRSLQCLPEALATMTAITELDLWGCAGLQSLPAGIFTSLTALRRLNLGGCRGLQLEGVQGITLSRLTGLETLGLWKCDHLLFLLSQQGSPAALRNLHLSGCTSFQSLPEGVAALEMLEKLFLFGCERLQSLSHLPQGSGNRLWNLDLKGCGGLDQPLVWETIASLTSLRRLSLSGWERMQALPDQIASLQNLKWLYLAGCSSLRSLPESVTSLTRLHTLDLQDCKSLESLPPGITKLVRLEKLDLSGCTSLGALPQQLTHWVSGIDVVVPQVLDHSLVVSQQ